MQTKGGVGRWVAVARRLAGLTQHQLAGPTRGSVMKAPAVMCFAVTDVGGIVHLITEDAMAAGRSSGRYAAVCGGAVLAASLTTRECGYCRSCRCWRAGR